MEDTVFSQIIRREISANIQYEDENFIAFDDIKPSSPIDIVIATKQPYPTLQDVPIANDRVFAGLLLTARKVAEKLEISDNYRLVMNVGSEMQLVKHLHLHLMGGWTAEQLKSVKLKNI